MALDDIRWRRCNCDDVGTLLAEVARLRDKLASIDGVLQKCDRGSRDGWPGALVVIAEIVESATT